MEDSAKVLTARVAAMAPRILAGTTASVALSDLSGRLGTIAGRCHAKLVRLEPLEDSATAGLLHRASAVAVLETDFRGLSELLQFLARDTLVTFVDRVQLTPADPLAAPAVPEQIDMELRLSAWYLTLGAGS
jgi:hypothetical protein